MSYNPYKDYLRLTDVAWQTDLHIHLEQLRPAAVPQESNLADELFCNVLANSSSSCDQMEDFNSSIQDEFQNNGVEAPMDEVDNYQVRCRGRVAIQFNNAAGSGRSGERRRQEKKLKTLKGCVFCKNNGRSPEEYLSHVLKDSAGNVSCPVLRKYTCPKCGVSGDKAHTIRYCPKL